MLYLFDLDGTLVSSYMDRPDRDYHAWELLPGRAARIAALRAAGFVGIVTNQAGVAFGHIAEDDFRRKIAGVAAALGYAHVELWSGGEPEEFSVIDYGFPQRWETVVEEDGPSWQRPLLAGQLAVHVCYADGRARDPRYRQGAERRKPSGAMIREAAQSWPDGAEGIVYVGDRPEDEAAARDAGVRFRWAEEFFR